MSETDELFSAVQYIKNKVDALEKIEILNLRSQIGLKKEYEELLKNDSLLLQVYKAIDGIRAQQEIADILQTNKMNVSNRISVLEEYGLIELKTVDGKKKIFKHSAAEKAFGFSKNSKL